MKLARGARPCTIWAFAACAVLIALINLFGAITDLELTEDQLVHAIPWVDWNGESTIIAVFTGFTISLIPVVWIVGFASRIACWVLLFFGLLKIPGALFTLLTSVWFADGVFLHLMEPSLILAALVFVFSDSASRWLRQEEASPETFA